MGENEVLSEPQYMSGRVSKIKYRNGNFYILNMVLDGKESGLGGGFLASASKAITVRGDVPLKVQLNTWFGFRGQWVRHPKYGKQIQILQAPVIEGGWSKKEIVNALSANEVSPIIVEMILSHAGDDKFVETLESRDLLAKVPGLAKFSAGHVYKRWAFVKAQFETMSFLSGMNLSSRTQTRIWKHFGEDAAEVLNKEPYRLVEVPGVTLEHVKALCLQKGLNEPEKLTRAGIIYMVKNNPGFGHLFTTLPLLNRALTLQLDTTTADIAKALVALHKKGDIVLDRKTRPGTTAVYDPWSFEMESESAKMLVRRDKTARLLPKEEATEKYIKGLRSIGPKTKEESFRGGSRGLLGRVVATAVEEWGSQAHLSLSKDQEQGVINALVEPVSILGGLPGTGKTTSLLAAVRILQDAEIPFLLCAPTGIAAKNLSARTGATASTIHRAFSAKGMSSDKQQRDYEGVVGESEKITVGDGGTEWGFSPDNPHPADVVIIDEASMMDQHLLYRLLHCTKPTARLVFVGDYAQLPSVGPGNVLRDLINAKVFPTIKLDRIFRQDDTSGIVYAAHSMHKGEVPETDKDFRFYPQNDEVAVRQMVVKMAQKLYESRHQTGRTFQVLSPKHRGEVGVTRLNQVLRELLNPASPGRTEARIGDWNIREGDRVMVIKNRYGKEEEDPDIFNGDIGKVSRINLGKEEVTLRIFGQPPLEMQIKFDEVPSLLSLAYATTVHKSQGLEYDYVIIPVVKSFHHQLQRNLIYTAITRARERVFMVGEWSAFEKSVHNAKEDDRLTLFKDRLVRGFAA